MNYTDKAKKWLDGNPPKWAKMGLMKDAVLAFASFLDGEERPFGIYDESPERDDCCDKCGDLDENGQHAHHVHCQPRKEDKPCEHDYCVDRHECKRCGFLWPDQPKPEPIEEWVDPFDYDWSNDPERDFRRIAGVLVDIGKRLNAVCRRLNTITK